MKHAETYQTYKDFGKAFENAAKGIMIMPDHSFFLNMIFDLDSVTSNESNISQLRFKNQFSSLYVLIFKHQFIVILSFTKNYISVRYEV